MLRHVIYFGEDSWRQMVDSGTEFSSPVLSCRDVTNIQYTSGTTGSPKGVLLTHRNILNNAMLGGRGMNLSEPDRICVPVPLYHCFGSVGGTIMMLTTGKVQKYKIREFEIRELGNEQAVRGSGVDSNS